MAKRVLDLLIALPGLIFLSPIFLLISACVKIDSTGPVFFRQVRVGRYGKTFNILKFRTMHYNSGEPGLSITVGNDPRITKFGKFLRNLKLDELPQLLNVIKGEMSIVGPRPEVPEYVARYPDEARIQVLSIRPGITDLAAIAFRNEEALLRSVADPESMYLEQIMPRKLAMYVDYVNSQSVWLDLSIIGRTIRIIFSR